VTTDAVFLGIIALINGFGVTVVQLRAKRDEAARILVAKKVDEAAGVLAEIKTTGDTTHQIVNSQKTAMEAAIQALRVTVADLKQQLGIPLQPGEAPDEPPP